MKNDLELDPETFYDSTKDIFVKLTGINETTVVNIASNHLDIVLATNSKSWLVTINTKKKLPIKKTWKSIVQPLSLQGVPHITDV